MMVRLLIAVLAIVCARCTAGLTQASAREPTAHSGESGAKIFRAATPTGEVLAAPTVYVKQKDLQIVAKPPVDNAGSLFQLPDRRNDLFSSYHPPERGDFVTVKVVVNRQKHKKDGKDGKDTKDAKKTTPDKDDKTAKKEAEEELLEALPSLAPADRARFSMQESFRMRITQRLANGDVIGVLDRESESPYGGEGLLVRARLPLDKLTSGEEILTSDLADVSVVETHNGELREHASSGWEDEYTMWMSGFTEAKSKYAADLEDKRQQLAHVRDQMENRLKSLGSERRQMAKEREGLLKKQVDDQRTIEGLKVNLDERNKKVDELNTQVKDQEGAITKLNGKDEEADEKEDPADK